MTAETHETQTPADSTPASPPPPGASDELLQLMAFLAQEKGIEGVPLTVSVGGQMMTGSVIGRDTWFKEMSTLVDEQGGGVLTPLVDGLGRFAAPPATDTATSDGLGHEHYGFLHFRDARFMAGQALTNRGNLWRVRLDSIDAWAFGVLSGS